MRFVDGLPPGAATDPAGTCGPMVRAVRSRSFAPPTASEGGSAAAPRVVFAACLLYLVAGIARASGGDFASAVIDYSPAPGQFVNNPTYNNPARALGPPVGGGTLAADNTKVVSLGGFGGSITLRFDQTVLDDPCNPFGLDFIVFGNAFWVAGNPNRRFAEAAVIEISLDVNRNGLADDPWFIIPGTHIPNAPPASVPADSLESQAWDNNASTPTPPSNLAWYPAGAPPFFITMTFALPALFDSQILQNPNGLSATLEGIRGYADCSPTLILGDTNADNIIDHPSLAPADFYTVPDNPYLVGVTHGSGGGDSFDIAWAVDPLTGAPANLRGFDFIRITNGVNHLAGVTGEVSPEIGGVSRVRPRESFFDLTSDGAADIEDLYRWHELRAANDPAADLNGDTVITDADRALMQRCIRRADEAEEAR